MGQETGSRERTRELDFGGDRAVRQLRWEEGLGLGKGPASGVKLLIHCCERLAAGDCSRELAEWEVAGHAAGELGRGEGLFRPSLRNLNLITQPCGWQT